LLAGTALAGSISPFLLEQLERSKPVIPPPIVDTAERTATRQRAVREVESETIAEPPPRPSFVSRIVEQIKVKSVSKELPPHQHTEECVKVDREAITALLKDLEGVRKHRYFDTMGNASVGIGANLDMFKMVEVKEKEKKAKNNKKKPHTEKLAKGKPKPKMKRVHISKELWIKAGLEAKKFDSVWKGRADMTPGEIDTLFSFMLEDCIRSVKRLIANELKDMPHEPDEKLTSFLTQLVFHKGPTGTRKMTDLLDAFREGDFEAAAAAYSDALSSVTPGRVGKVVSLLARESNAEKGVTR